MQLEFDMTVAEGYKSKSQIARRITENWVEKQMYCPRCKNSEIKQFENNKPVSDFYCPSCSNQYELKGKGGNLGNTITDGAYNTMIQRITSNSNPDLFLMGYHPTEYVVNEFIYVPKHFFVPDIIVKRKPLADTARRAGWVGCNIEIGKIPIQGKIYIISNGTVVEHDSILHQTEKSMKLETKELNARGWLLDILKCVNSMNSELFTLAQMYEWEESLSKKYILNNNVKAKIRQQLQILRDKGMVEFLDRGVYKRLC